MMWYFTDMLSLAWGLLEFVVTYIFILCMVIFIGIMAWTMLDIAKKLANAGAPGWKKLFRKA